MQCALFTPHSMNSSIATESGFARNQAVEVPVVLKEERIVEIPQVQTVPVVRASQAIAGPGYPLPRLEVRQSKVKQALRPSTKAQGAQGGSGREGRCERKWSDSREAGGICGASRGGTAATGGCVLVMGGVALPNVGWDGPGLGFDLKKAPLVLLEEA